MTTHAIAKVAEDVRRNRAVEGQCWWYKVRAEAPSPKSAQRLRVYDGLVSRSAMIEDGQEFDAFMAGLAAHLAAGTGGVIEPRSITLLKLEIVDEPTPAELAADKRRTPTR